MKFVNRVSASLFFLIVFLELCLILGNHQQKAINLASILFLLLVALIVSAWFIYEKR